MTEETTLSYRLHICQLYKKKLNICTESFTGVDLCARTREFQTLRPVVSLSSWSRPWIFLGGLQARVWDSFSPETAFGLDVLVPATHRSSLGDCTFPVAGARGMEQCYHPVSPTRRPSLIPATFENFSVPATTASITLISVSWSWSTCTQHHVNPGKLNQLRYSGIITHWNVDWHLY